MSGGTSIARRGDGAKTGYERVFAFVREQLLTGALKTGDRLLPERELAARLGVSRPVIREVLRSLSAIGVIEIRQGQGSIVREPDFSQFSDMFSLILAQKADVVDEIMEARIAIERQAVRLACQRAGMGDLERMGRALEQIARTVKDPALGGEADYAFHATLVEAAHAPVLSSLYAAIAALLQRSHLHRRELITGVEGIETYLVDHHHKLFDAIAGKDAAQADALLVEHFAIGADFQRRAGMG